MPGGTIHLHRHDLPAHVHHAAHERRRARQGSQILQRIHFLQISALDRIAPDKLASINSLLIRSERALTSAGGLPNRPWYRHLLYAPGFYTGYGVKTVPGVREAIEQKEWGLADSEIVRVGKVLEDEASVVTQAAVALRGAE